MNVLTKLLHPVFYEWYGNLTEGSTHSSPLLLLIDLWVCLNIMMPFYQYRIRNNEDDKTVVRPSYLHNWDSDSGKMEGCTTVTYVVHHEIFGEKLPICNGATLNKLFIEWIVCNCD